MKMKEFKELTTEEQLKLLNTHLSEIKGMKGRLEDKFSNETFEFSYSMLRKSFGELGIKVTNYVAYKIDEEPVVNVEQNVVKTSKNTEKSIVKTKQEIVKGENLSLTNDEILFVKQLFKEKQSIVNTKQTLTMQTFEGPKKTTGISVYVDLWEDWNEFKKKFPYSSTDLMAMALKEFMEKYK